MLLSLLLCLLRESGTSLLQRLCKSSISWLILPRNGLYPKQSSATQCFNCNHSNNLTDCQQQIKQLTLYNARKKCGTTYTLCTLCPLPILYDGVKNLDCLQVYIDPNAPQRLQITKNDVSIYMYIQQWDLKIVCICELYLSQPGLQTVL